MHFIVLVLILCTAGQISAQELNFKELKELELERLRTMAEAGVIPRARLELAQSELADAEDNNTLRRTLYGTLRIEDFTREQSDLMIQAAQRLVERQSERMSRSAALVAEGVLPAASLRSLQEELDFRQKALDLARFRAKLVEELADHVTSEGEVADGSGVRNRGRVVERFDGHGIFRESDFVRVSTAFRMKFARPMPVSARGETALHRALGFDHRGRVDIAVNPDQPEGVWLRKFLEKAKIPYYAFRAAVRGKATAPHIHIGPPSSRLRLAD